MIEFLLTLLAFLFAAGSTQLQSEKNLTILEKNEVSFTKRAFFMGNALVIGLIEKVGAVLAEEIRKI